jgi:hypothetical protein
VHRAGRWLLIAGSEHVLPRDPAIATVDPALYDQYAGKYEYAQGTTDTVTREGDRLIVQATGQAKEELFPETETTYFSKGQDWRIVFERDARGVVTALRFRQHGQDFVAKKIE